MRKILVYQVLLNKQISPLVQQIYFVTAFHVMSREQTAGLSHAMKIDNNSIEMWKSSNIWERP